MKKEEIRLRPMTEFCDNSAVFEEGRSERLRQALEIASEIHKNDRRKVTGEPYINHCVAVASILEKWGADEDEVVAGLLHDTWEDHPDLINLKIIEEMFGERVAFLVDGVTKLKTKEGEKSEFETLRKVTRDSLIDVGVAKIKLADRKHNMMTMEGMKSETTKKKAKETLAVYAPLAESFGLWQVKKELEDLAFVYFDPERFLQIKEMVDADPRLRTDFVLGLEREIRGKLLEFGLDIQVEHQVGGYWEISEKQKRRGMRGGSMSLGIVEIPDVISFRVIGSDKRVEDCYLAMGVVRMMFAEKLIVSRHQDLLIEPAVNGYSALKDVFVLEEGSVEICFTTRDKEKFNNWGVTTLSEASNISRKLVFTPKEELMFLEPTATGIDVAYKRSSLLGLRAVAIKIDGAICGLETVVPNTSVVEILFDVNKKSPDKSWLSFSNLETRRTIEKQLMISERDFLVETGREILRNEVLIPRGVLEIRDLDEAVINQLLMDSGCWYGLTDLYYKVAMGMDLLKIEKKLDQLGVPVGVFTTVKIEGENAIGVARDVAVLLARHRADTRNVVERVFENNRFLIRILLKVDYRSKKKIEEELKKKYQECVVV